MIGGDFNDIINSCEKKYEEDLCKLLDHIKFGTILISVT